MDYFKTLSEEQLIRIVKEVTGPARRELAGDEYEHMRLILNLLEPISSSNNQRTLTDVYEQNNITYHVTYGYGHNPIIEEITDFDGK